MTAFYYGVPLSNLDVSVRKFALVSKTRLFEQEHEARENVPNKLKKRIAISCLHHSTVQGASLTRDYEFAKSHSSTHNLHTERNSRSTITTTTTKMTMMKSFFLTLACLLALWTPSSMAQGRGFSFICVNGRHTRRIPTKFLAKRTRRPNIQAGRCPVRACPRDLKICPNGRRVGRDPNRNCRFAPCRR